MSKFLNIFSKKQIGKKEEKIIIDNREQNSSVVTELKKLGFKIEFQQLPVADYIIGKTAIERKTISDLKSSIKNKRIFSQLLELKQYPKHFFLLEGLESTDPYSGGIHENAFRGFLLSVISEYQIPIIFTLNEKDTAKYLAVLTRKKPKSEQGIRASKIFLSKKERLQFILEGFPQIGPATAKKLLGHFKSLHALFNATQKELFELIGKKSEVFSDLLNEKY